MFRQTKLGPVYVKVLRTHISNTLNCVSIKLIAISNMYQCIKIVSYYVPYQVSLLVWVLIVLSFMKHSCLLLIDYPLHSYS